jgi:hypothetical protein
MVERRRFPVSIPCIYARNCEIIESVTWNIPGFDKGGVCCVAKQPTLIN